MDKILNGYWKYWRFGWVAFIALLLAGFGVNLMGRAFLFLIPLHGYYTRLALAGTVFLLIGLPYMGWILDMARGHIERFQKARLSGIDND